MQFWAVTDPYIRDGSLAHVSSTADRHEARSLRKSDASAVVDTCSTVQSERAMLARMLIDPSDVCKRPATTLHLDTSNQPWQLRSAYSYVAKYERMMNYGGS